MRSYPPAWMMALARAKLSGRGIRRVDTGGTHGFQAVVNSSNLKATKFFNDAHYGVIGALIAAARHAIELRRRARIPEESLSELSRRTSKIGWTTRRRRKRSTSGRH